jgi:hypothetical protein
VATFSKTDPADTFPNTMKTIETEQVTATILSDRIVLVRAKSGVEINWENARHGNRLIADAMPGDYGQIIDREEDYSVAPVEVFTILNANGKLKALAIVVHRESSLHTAEIDKRFSKKPLEVFTSVDQARAWLEQVLDAER